MGQVGIIRKKESEMVTTIHWQARRIRRLQNNFFEAEAYAVRITSEECFYWKTIVVEVGLRYRFERFTVLTDIKLVKVTVDAPKFNNDVKLPRSKIARVWSLILFEGIKFHFVPTLMMMADCLPNAHELKGLTRSIEE